MAPSKSLRDYGLISETDSIIPGTEEWLKIISSHLNKAYGIGGLGVIGSMVNE